MILGVYYLTQERKNALGEGIVFSDPNEVIRAYQLNQVHPHALIGISTKAYPQKP
jgi:DNA-directed RNA polymerase subunit beta'